jgi:hypothetical protein
MGKDGTGLGGSGGTGGGHPASSGGGKNYTDFGEAGQALTHLDDAYVALQDAWSKGQQMELIRGPGRDPASTSFSGTAKSHAEQHRKDIHQYQAEVKSIRDTLQAHLESQRRTEEENAANHKSILG